LFGFGKRKKNEKYLICEGGSVFDIVGESHYQAALERISGGKTTDSAEIDIEAFLVAEPENPYDKDAVKVEINGYKVGHIPKTHTQSFHNITRSLGLTKAKCKGTIVGGWKRDSGDEGSFGVKLDLKWPPRGILSD